MELFISWALMEKIQFRFTISSFEKDKISLFSGFHAHGNLTQKPIMSRNFKIGVYGFENPGFRMIFLLPGKAGENTHQEGEVNEE